MRHHKRGDHSGDRISRIVRDSVEADVAREVGGRMKAFITERPIASACLGLAAGVLLGMLIRRGN
jgi:ElaB/YqjD/DUF883 family membrane-anchored ribosome-binding protein